MTYDQSDLATLERTAFQRGDTVLAEVAGYALDLSAADDRAEALSDVVEGIQARIAEANYRTGKKSELRALIDAIISELEEVPK